MSARDDILERWRDGAISREIALAQILLTGEVPDPATLPAPVAELARAQADRLEPLAALARTGFDVGDVASAAALFDRLAAEAPDAAVAFYTLGDPGLLAAATAELVAVIRAWASVEGRDVLDFGCGAGRVALALAPHAGSVVGMDVSSGMIARATERAANVPNVSFRQGGGRTVPATDRAFDVAVAADSFPFIVQAGATALDSAVAEFDRVLRPGGDLLVFNWSYRGDPAADIADAHALAARHGFEVLTADAAPFVIWDGRGFHLRRR